MEPQLPKNYTLLTFDNTDSTNEEAKRLVRAGMGGDENDVTVIWGKQQSNGKGRLGRQWHSPQGNLYLSLLLKPNYSLQTAAQLSFVTALALRHAICEALPTDKASQVQCKWPNDVLIEGKKIAGILIESATLQQSHAPQWLIIGMGLNVAYHPESDIRHLATNLTEHGSTLSLEEVITTLTRHFDDYYRRWVKHGFGALKEAWTQQAIGIDKKVSIAAQKKNYQGIFKGINHEGALMLTMGNHKVMTFSHGDVSLDVSDITHKDKAVS